jgi:hypothetical protein
MFFSKHVPRDQWWWRRLNEIALPDNSFNQSGFSLSIIANLAAICGGFTPG